MAIDDKKLKEFLGKAINDMGAGMSAVLVILGDQLGLYKAMANAGPLTPVQLAEKTGTAERYVREWLSNQACGGYVAYDPATGTFFLPDEQAMALADETSNVFLPGNFHLMIDMFQTLPRMAERFRTGQGLGWGEHDPGFFSAIERALKPNYVGNLVSRWIPALDGVEAKLKQGAVAADVGCGHGASTLLMAQAFPKSRFHGFDSHDLSIRAANERAKAAGLGDRVTFEVADAATFPNRQYDFIAHFDCLHDMGDPAGAAKHVRETIAPDGTWMIVEPFANDKLEENLTPVGRMFYAASTMVCVPASLACHGPALGAQAGEGSLKAIVEGAGFTRFRRATQTRFNLVLEARP